MTTLFLIAGLLNNIDPSLLGAICYVETKHNVNAYNSTDGNSPSYGICQIKLGTAKGLGFKGTGRDLQDARTNAFWSARYLQYLSHKTGDNLHLTVSAYNCGRPCRNTRYVGAALNEYSKRKEVSMLLRDAMSAQNICPVRLLVLSKMQSRSEVQQPAGRLCSTEWREYNHRLLPRNSWEALK